MMIFVDAEKSVRKQLFLDDSLTRMWK